MNFRTLQNERYPVKAATISLQHAGCDIMLATGNSRTEDEQPHTHTRSQHSYRSSSPLRWTYFSSVNRTAISTPKSTLAALIRDSTIHLFPPLSLEAMKQEPHAPLNPCPGLSIPTHREGNWCLTSDSLAKPDKTSLRANNMLSDQWHLSCNKMAIPHLHSDRIAGKTGKITAGSHRILLSGLCTS